MLAWAGGILAWAGAADDFRPSSCPCCLCHALASFELCWWLSEHHCPTPTKLRLTPNYNIAPNYDIAPMHWERYTHASISTYSELIVEAHSHFQTRRLTKSIPFNVTWFANLLANCKWKKRIMVDFGLFSGKFEWIASLKSELASESCYTNIIIQTCDQHDR